MNCYSSYSYLNANKDLNKIIESPRAVKKSNSSPIQKFRSVGKKVSRLKNKEMDFAKRSKVKPLKSPDEDSLDRLLPHNCLFYILPPLIDVSLKDFEDLAIERLKLLRIVEQAGVKYPKILSEEWKEHIINELNIAGLKHFVRLLKGNGNAESDLNARRRDYLSHWIMRISYCASEDLRRYVIIFL